MIEIPKFVYHGTTQWQYNLLKNQSRFKLYIPLNCWNSATDGLSFSVKRARQESSYPTLIIIDTSLNKVIPSKPNLFLVQDFLNEKGHTALIFDKRYIQGRKYDDVYLDLDERSKLAQKLSDFLD